MAANKSWGNSQKLSCLPPSRSAPCFPGASFWPPHPPASPLLVEDTSTWHMPRMTHLWALLPCVLLVLHLLPKGSVLKQSKRLAHWTKRQHAFYTGKKKKKEEKSRSCVATSLRHHSRCLLQLHHRQDFLNRIVNVTLQDGNFRSTAFKNKRFAGLQRDAMVILSPTCWRMPRANKLLRELLETCLGRNLFLISPRKSPLIKRQTSSTIHRDF